MKHRFFPILFASCLALTACEEPASHPVEDETTALSVYVVNYPLQYFAERIGGDRINVEFPVPPGTAPRDWAPEPEIVRRYQAADLILLNGADYARWTQRVSLPAGPRVNTAQNIQDRLLTVPDAVTHSHGPEGAHTHAGTAPFIWLDPTLAIEQARVIRNALSERLPEHSGEFEERFDALAADLRVLDQELGEITSMARNHFFLGAHPVYHYLDARYDLGLDHRTWDPETVPDSAELEDLSRELDSEGTGLILWHQTPLPGVAARLEEHGFKNTVFSPVARSPQTGDFLTRMEQNAAELRNAISNSE